MTTPNNVPVTAADREAAADWIDSRHGYRASSHMRGGADDNHTLIQAFAHHRHTATEALRAEVERLREALVPFAQYADAILRRRDGAQDEPVAVDRLVFGIDGQHVTIGDLRRARAALTPRRRSMSEDVAVIVAGLTKAARRAIPHLSATPTLCFGRLRVDAYGLWWGRLYHLNLVHSPTWPIGGDTFALRLTKRGLAVRNHLIAGDEA